MKDFVILPIEEQIKKCAEIFGLDSKYSLDYLNRLPILPEFIPEELILDVKWCAVPNTVADLYGYRRLTKKIVKLINLENNKNKHHGIYKNTVLESLIQIEKNINFLDKISSQQKGNILLLPVVIKKNVDVLPEKIIETLDRNEFVLGVQSTIIVAIINNISNINFICLGDSCTQNGYLNYLQDISPGFGSDEDVDYFNPRYENRDNDIPTFSSDVFGKIVFQNHIYRNSIEDFYSIHVFSPYEKWGEVNSCELLNRPRDYFELIEIYLQKYPVGSGELYFHYYSDLIRSQFGERQISTSMGFYNFNQWFKENKKSKELQILFVKHGEIMEKLDKKATDKLEAMTWTTEDEIALQMKLINNPEKFPIQQGLFSSYLK